MQLKSHIFRAQQKHMLLLIRAQQTAYFELILMIVVTLVRNTALQYDNLFFALY